MDHGGSIVKTTVIHHHEHMSREDPQMKIRLTPDLKGRIEEAAAQNGRSMNAEIIARLQQSFLQPEEAPAFRSVERLGSEPTFVDEVVQAVGELHKAIEEIRELKRVALPAGTPVRSDRMAMLRRMGERMGGTEPPLGPILGSPKIKPYKIKKVFR